MECTKCGHETEVHYGVFCPKCDDTCFIVGERMVYDLFKLMYYMEANGYMSKEEYWKDYVVGSYNIVNDTYIDAYFGEGDNEKINRYHKRVRELLHIENDDTVIMKVSW